MARLTRTESQSRNRERVIASARSLFLRDGYQATSLAAIADEAGFSTGVVYSNFAGKSELALLVLREIQSEQLTAVRTALAGAETLAAKLDALQAWADAALDSGWTRCEVEFALDARNNTRLVAEEAQRHTAVADAAVETLRDLVPPGLAEIIPMRALAEAFMNLSYGLAMRRLVDPSVTAEGMLKPLRETLRTLGLLRD